MNIEELIKYYENAIENVKSSIIDKKLLIEKVKRDVEILECTVEILKSKNKSRAQVNPYKT